MTTKWFKHSSINVSFICKNDKSVTFIVIYNFVFNVYCEHFATEVFCVLFIIWMIYKLNLFTGLPNYSRCDNAFNYWFNMFTNKENALNNIEVT